MLHCGAFVGDWMPSRPSLIVEQCHLVSKILWWLQMYRLLLSKSTCVWPLTHSQLLVHPVCWTGIQTYGIDYTSWQDNHNVWDVQIAEDALKAYWSILLPCHCLWYRCTSHTKAVAYTAGHEHNQRGCESVCLSRSNVMMLVSCANRQSNGYIRDWDTEYKCAWTGM